MQYFRPYSAIHNIQSADRFEYLRARNNPLPQHNERIHSSDTYEDEGLPAEIILALTNSAGLVL